MNTRVFLLISLLTACGRLLAQDNELSMIRIQESLYGSNTGNTSYLVIVHPDLSTTRIELENLERGKNAEVNAAKIAEEMHKLLSQGFSIQSCSIGTGDQLMSTMVVMTRPSKK